MYALTMGDWQEAQARGTGQRAPATSGRGMMTLGCTSCDEVEM